MSPGTVLTAWVGDQGQASSLAISSGDTVTAQPGQGGHSRGGGAGHSGGGGGSGLLSGGEGGDGGSDGGDGEDGHWRLGRESAPCGAGTPNRTAKPNLYENMKKL